MRGKFVSPSGFSDAGLLTDSAVASANGNSEVLSGSGWTQRLAKAAASIGGLAATPTPPSKKAVLGAAVATMAAVVSGGGESKAAVVSVSNRPVTNTWSRGSASDVSWDVDGDNVANFSLVNRQGVNDWYLDLFSTGGGRNGQGVLGAASRTLFGYGPASPLVAGALIGPAPSAGFNWKAPSNNRTLVGYNGDIGRSGNPTYNPLFGFEGFQEGDSYFGFRFGSQADPNYGWAMINFGPLSNGARTVTIKSWAYNDVAGAPIHVGEVPAPIGIAGLAAGAAWARKLRRRIRQASEKA